MKKHFALLASLILSTSLAQAQTGGGTGTGGAGTGAGQGAGGQAGGAGGGQPSQSGGIGNQAPQPGTGVNQQQPGQPGQPGVGGQEGTIFNQPAGANQPQPGQFGGTNQIRFGGTNQTQFGGTNRVLPEGTNRILFGTNINQGGAINDPSGATSVTNQGAGFGGATNQQPGNINQQQPGNLGDQAFALQMRSVLARPGSSQIFFPQTRSTVSVQNQNGALVLQGSVTSEQEKKDIESRIKNTPGVVSIDNQLQVADGRSGESRREARGTQRRILKSIKVRSVSY